MNHKSPSFATRVSSLKFFIKKSLPLLAVITILFLISSFFIYRNYQQGVRLNNLARENTDLEQKADSYQKELNEIKSEDQYVRNEKLQEEITNIEETYKDALGAYEKLLDAKTKGIQVERADELFAQTLSYLSERNFSSASASIEELSEIVNVQETKIINEFSIPSNVVESNSPPSSGYSRQKVSTEVGDFLVDLVAADLNSTRVIIDTASDSDCGNDCPVLPLGDYVSRSGGFAGINGSYFCPASYPSCAGKTNTYDTLLMNKNKVYFNSDNNVYSTVPVAIFGSGWVRFMGRSLDWGRDTSVDGIIANQPLLLSGGNIAFGGDGDPKKGSRGSRSFVGVNGSTIYIGVVHNATVVEVAYALKGLGLTDALNLDSGGSTALWSGGYKVGPGRNIPNAIIFVRK